MALCNMTVLGAAAALLAMSVPVWAAGPEVVKGPGFNPECFAPLKAETKFFKWPAKKGPYRIAVANGFVGNTWRIQMIKTAKAFRSEDTRLNSSHPRLSRMPSSA